ncbi:MAG: DUF86 domain-containing protein [Cyanobacteria bacterium J06643_4]
MYRDEASLNDIYRAGLNCLHFSQDLTQEDLKADEMRLSAIAYQILIIGEATTRLSNEFKVNHPEVPWKRMIGMRNIMAHQYDKIDLKTLWDVLHKSIPEMMAKVEPLI